MHGLNLLFSKYSQLLVLRVLHHAGEPLTGREIERRTGLSNRAVMMALDQLTDTAAVECEQTAHAYWYTLNRTNYFVVKALKPAFEAEDLFWDDFRKIVRRNVHPRPMAAVATGPLARDESAASDRIELTLIFSTGRNRVRAFNSMEELQEALWKRYAVSIDPILLDINIMNQDKYDALWRRVEREGILLFGTLP